MGWCSVKSGTPLSYSSDSCGFIVSTARVKSALVIARPGSRRIFWMDATTSLGSSASLLTCRSVSRSVKASTPLRRNTVRPSTDDELLRSWISSRVMSGRSWSMAVSILATTVAMRRRAAILFCSTRRSLSRWMVSTVDAPKPMISTTTMSSVILAVRRSRSMSVDRA